MIARAWLLMSALSSLFLLGWSPTIKAQNGNGSGYEVQLAGIRLGSLAVDRDENGFLKNSCLLRVWGPPDFVIIPSRQQQQQPAGGGGGQPGGAPAGMPGMGGPGGGMPGMGGPGGGMPGMGGPGGEMPGGAPSGPQGATAPAVGGAPGGAGQAQQAAPPEPSWVTAVRATLRPDQVEWIYKRGEASLGFIIDQNGLVQGIVVAGPQFAYARTAMSNPFKTIKLGDRFERVLQRYGWPDENTPVSANEPSRDFEMRYTRTSNIIFTVRDYRVVRIFIYFPERVSP